MRTIKFRGKDVFTDAWRYGDLVHNKKVTTTGLEPRTMVGGYEVDPETVGSNTGLFDKNGKEIYEGDVLRSDIFPFSFINEEKTCRDLRFGTIVWDEVGGKYFMLCHTNKKLSVDKYFEGVHLDINQLWCSNFEVIGNVHDPEWQKLNIKKE
jgi:uncharacterized phage protein (TIGR01671 family)